MRPDSFQWCPETGQGVMGTNWSSGSSSWTGGRTSSLWGWWSTGTGCPEGLWSLLLWRYSRPTWTRSCAACCRWPCFGRGVGLDDPQRSLPTPNILWFCNLRSCAQAPEQLWHPWGASLSVSAVSHWWLTASWSQEERESPQDTASPSPSAQQEDPPPAADAVVLLHPQSLSGRDGD